MHVLRLKKVDVDGLILTVSSEHVALVFTVYGLQERHVQDGRVVGLYVEGLRDKVI